jgi:hypothetical protein
MRILMDLDKKYGDDSSRCHYGAALARSCGIAELRGCGATERRSDGETEHRVIPLPRFICFAPLNNNLSRDWIIVGAGGSAGAC